MFRAIKIATLAALMQIVEGHVRAIPTGANGLGCRECNGKASPGPFRVSGPLGSNAAFGSNGVATMSQGDEVELAISYNGGHQSNTLNFFNVRYACGAAAQTQAAFSRAGSQDKDTINCNPPCKQLTANEITEVDGQAATAQNYPVDATQSKTSGYKVKFAIPEIQGTGDDRKCTFALVEGRDWGAGWDVEVLPANVPTPAPVVTPAPVARSVQGTYQFTEQNCQRDAPGCLCLGGQLTIKHDPGENIAQAVVNIPGYPSQAIALAQNIPGAWSSSYILSQCGKPDQELDINLAPEQQSTTSSILNVGVVSDIPTICGSIVKTSAQTLTAAQPALIQQCPGCQDSPGWVDNAGDACAKYTSCQNELWRTKPLGYYEQYANAQGLSARDACCGCGGGTTKQAAIPPPASLPPGQPGVGVPTQPAGGVGGGMFGNNQQPAIYDSAPGMGTMFGAVLTMVPAMFM